MLVACGRPFPAVPRETRPRPPVLRILLALLVLVLQVGRAQAMPELDQLNARLDGYLQQFQEHQEASGEEAALGYVETLYRSDPELVVLLGEEFARLAPELTGPLFDLSERHVPEEDRAELREIREEFEDRLERVLTYLDTDPGQPDPPMEYLDAGILLAIAGEEVSIGHEGLEEAEDVDTLAAQARLLDGFARTCLLGDYLVEHPEQVMVVVERVTRMDPEFAEQVYAVAMELFPEHGDQMERHALAFAGRLDRAREAAESLLRGDPPERVLAGLEPEEQVLLRALTLSEEGLAGSDEEVGS